MMPGARQSAERARLRRRRRRTAAARSPMRSTCWRATSKASVGDLRYYRRHAARGLLEPDGRGAARRGLALYGDAPALGADLRGGAAAGRATHRTSTGTAPTTARACATARRCWRWPPRASRCRRSCRQLVKLVARRPRRRQALDQHPGGGLDAARGARAEGRQRGASRSTSTAPPHTGAYSTRIDRRRPADNPVTIANTGKDAAAGGGDDGRRARPAAAGRRRRLRPSSAPTTRSTAARPTSPRSQQNERYRRRAEGQRD